MIDQTRKPFIRLPVNSNLTFSNISKSENQYLTHGYHRYPAKFTPKLAAYLIENNTRKGDLICDPFGGCGTTLVEAKVNNRNSIGIDINPLVGLISKTKITPINPSKLNRATIQLFERIEQKQSMQLSQKSSVSKSKRLSYWFDNETLAKLSLIYSRIQDAEDLEIRRFFQCAFSHILKHCSRWLMKSIKPTVDKDKKPVNPLWIFLRHIKFMTAKNTEFFNIVKKQGNPRVFAKFYIRDARRTKLPSGSIDYIITSPPYVTSYEYADLHQLSILWFDYTKEKEWINFKKRFIGTSQRMPSNKPLYSLLGEEIVNNLMLRDQHLAREVRVYYEDMVDFLLESKRILKGDKKMTLVLGNTTLKGVDILNAEVVYEQMSRLGFKELKVEKRKTSNKLITPYRDLQSGRFTSLSNPNKREAYQYEYLVTATTTSIGYFISKGWREFFW